MRKMNSTGYEGIGWMREGRRWGIGSLGNEAAGTREPGGSFVWRVSRTDVRNWLGADIKVSFRLIFLLCLPSLSLYTCLWPFL